jgi:two-component system LytT family sensor kinase
LKKNKRIIIIVVHAAVWICFFLLPYIFSPRPEEFAPNATINKFYITFYISINVFLCAFYYFNTLLLIPRLLLRRKWFLYILIITSSLIIFLYVPREITNWISGTTEETLRHDFWQRRTEMFKTVPNYIQNNQNQIHRPPHRNNRMWYFPGSYAIFILVLTVGTCIVLLQEWLKIEQKKDEIEHEKINTELSFLKSQVNPHFFFNTLNNIYSLAVIGSEQTAPAIMKLSSIMRYILSETQTNLVPLQNEIDFITNFIDLQSVRLTDKVKVNFKAEGDIEPIQIAPLLFIPFIENAFKYGISTKEKTVIEIYLLAANNKLSFTVSNTIVKAIRGETTGIGINNVKRRLELLYPNKHELRVEEQNNQFIVHLDIELL